MLYRFFIFSHLRQLHNMGQLKGSVRATEKDKCVIEDAHMGPVFAAHCSVLLSWFHLAFG